MSLDLDARRRAMLAEMGIRVWLPEPVQPSVATENIAVSPINTGASARFGRHHPAANPAVNRPASPPVTPAAGALRSAAAAAGDPAQLADATHPTHPANSVAAHPVSPVLPTVSHATGTGLPVHSLGWPDLQQAVAGCQACGLCQGRKNTVFGVGDVGARWMVVGEAPGENEDLQGLPFVGQAGQLLDNMLKAIGLHRQGQGAQAVYITNVLKCRPPANRNPQPQEVAQCEPYLRRQVALVQPQMILALGRFAAQSLLAPSVPDVAQLPLGKLRGQVHRYQGVPVVVSYHPAYLLRTPQDKAKSWADLCLALDLMQAQRASASD